tara:strand:- start:792 stop:1160 length:369 start_codon:yes stop_codon:yes gene_type:complete
MKVVFFSDSDYNFSAKLAKICDLQSEELFFLNDFYSLSNIKDKKDILVAIDFNDYKNDLDSSINLIKSIAKFPTCLLLDKMESKIQKRATSIGFDIVMTKTTFLMNFKTIKNQINNNPTNYQ